MQQKGMWIPLMASIGIGAAAYYSMTKNGRSMGQTMQQMVPLVSTMGMGRQSQQQQQPQQQNQQGQQFNQMEDNRPTAIQQ